MSDGAIIIATIAAIIIIPLWKSKSRSKYYEDLYHNELLEMRSASGTLGDIQEQVVRQKDKYEQLKNDLRKNYNDTAISLEKERDKIKKDHVYFLETHNNMRDQIKKETTSFAEKQEKERNKIKKETVSFSEKQEKERDKIKTETASFLVKHKNARDKIEKEMTLILEKYNKEINIKERLIQALNKDITVHFPWFAQIFADFEVAQDFTAARALKSKTRPALKAAEQLRLTSAQKKEWIKRAKEAEYNLAYLRSLSPIIEELSEDATVNAMTNTNIEEDPTKAWLSPEEYKALTPQQRNQLALDKYKASHNKSKRQIGRDYERYVGYIYESRGYKVEYKGILAGLEDLGRDLICTKCDETIIIQCKYWSSEKTIHEKHINQLFGTYMEYMLSRYTNDKQTTIFDAFDLARDNNCKACFWTKTTLSPTAKAFAAALHVEIHEKEEIGDYPIIKCNINKATGEKIYHLPFDLNYDNTVIEPKLGEFYAMTVEEAETKGFRHAYKWQG